MQCAGVLVHLARISLNHLYTLSLKRCPSSRFKLILQRRLTIWGHNGLAVAVPVTSHTDKSIIQNSTYAYAEINIVRGDFFFPPKQSQGTRTQILSFLKLKKTTCMFHYGTEDLMLKGYKFRRFRLEIKAFL